VIVNYSAALAAEEEGFDFAQYKGGTRWIATLERWKHGICKFPASNGPWIDA
jgi:hypothetical protein